MKMAKRVRVTILYLSLCLWLVAVTALAQDPPQRLFITGSDTGSPPTIELHVYGIDSQGNRLDLTPQTLALQHEGTSITPVDLIGTYQGGTFTVFLIDVPEGVAGQIPAIQEAISQFASPPTMVEQVDAVAIYRVGESAATQLLEPTTFHNSVRNFFATPLEPVTGATALVDSTMELLAEIETLKPTPGMVTSLIIISDGTDAVSTKFQPEDVPGRATNLGIAVHTIALDNENLSPLGQEIGRDYLEEVANGAWGIATSLSNTAQVPTIWERIASFRDQVRLYYTVEGLTGGTYTVELNLTDGVATKAETTVTVPPNLPSIVINLPPESRSLSLPDLEGPVNLRFASTLSWLDGETRSLTAAQLQVNGVVQDIPPEEIGAFTAAVEGLQYGNNVVQIAILDEQGMRVTSPPLILTVSEGPREIPEALAAGGSGFGRILGGIVLFLFAIAVVGGGGFLLWQRGLLKLPDRMPRLPKPQMPDLIPRGPSRRRARQQPETAVDPGAPPVGDYSPTAVQTRPVAYLDVLEAVSHAPAQIPLQGSEIRIGRSPAQANIAFENDITVSRLHAILVLEGNQYRIYDEQSTSGTWVNEQRVPEYGTPLINGDEIHMGAVHLRFRQP